MFFFFRLFSPLIPFSFSFFFFSDFLGSYLPFFLKLFSACVLMFLLCEREGKGVCVCMCVCLYGLAIISALCSETSLCVVSVTRVGCVA